MEQFLIDWEGPVLLWIQEHMRNDFLTPVLTFLTHLGDHGYFCIALTILFLLLKKTRIFSPLGVSMAGGVTHNIGQLTVAALVVENSKIYLYLPALLISGTVTGVLLGFGAVLILNRLKR